MNLPFLCDYCPVFPMGIGCVFQNKLFPTAVLETVSLLLARKGNRLDYAVKHMTLKLFGDALTRGF